MRDCVCSAGGQQAPSQRCAAGAKAEGQPALREPHAAQACAGCARRLLGLVQGCSPVDVALHSPRTARAGAGRTRAPARVGIEGKPSG